MGEFGIGQPVPREEDPYLVRGDGRYVDDVSAVSMTRAYVLRSQHSHAKIISIDVKRARQSPGVLHILTGNDAAVLALGLQRPKQPRKRRDGSPQFATPMPLLARDDVRFIGQPVAMVIAETLNEAKDAAELIEVEYEDLPAATTLEEATAPDAHAGVGRDARQLRLPARGRQQGGGREGHRLGRPRDQAPHADQPAHHGVDGAARLPRRIRSARRPLHAPLHGAGPASGAAHAGAGRVPHSGDQGPRDRRQCRRRLRHEGRRLSGISAGAAGGEAHRPAGEVDRRTAANPSSPTSTAATTSPRPSSRSTRTASSSPSRCATTATSAPTTPPTAAAARRPTISACSRAPTRSRPATSR